MSRYELVHLDEPTGYTVEVGPGKGAFARSVIGRLRDPNGYVLRSYLRDTDEDCVAAALQDLRNLRFGPYPPKAAKTSGDDKG